MSKKSRHPSQTHKLGFSIIMMLAMLFLAVFMIVSAVSQFRSGRIVSGCVSVLGAILFLGLTLLQSLALIRLIRNKKEHQEDQDGSV